MPSDAVANFAVTTVATAPSPATTGTSLKVQTGHGSRFPVTPFDAVVHATGIAFADPTNAEIVRVTGRSGDTLTIERHQQGSTAMSIATGWVIYAGFTAKTILDLLVSGFIADGGDGSLGLEDFGLTISFGNASNYANFLLRGDVTSAWEATNPVLGKNELVVDTVTGKAKLGDGVTKWNSLAPWAPTSFSVAEGDVRYLRLEKGGVLVKGTPAANKIIKALNTSAAEWTSGGEGGGITEAQFEELLEEHGILRTTPTAGFRLAGFIGGATENNPFVVTAVASDHGVWQEAQELVHKYAVGRMPTLVWTTSTGTKNLEADTYNRCESGTAGGVFVLPPGGGNPPTQGTHVLVDNKSGGTIKVKGKIDGSVAVNMNIEHNEVVLFFMEGPTTSEVWHPVGGYRTQAALEEIVKAILIAPLRPKDGASSAIVVRGAASGVEAPEKYETSAGATIWKREPDGSEVYTLGTPGAIKLKKIASETNPRLQLNSSDGSLVMTDGTSGVEGKLERGTSRGSNAAIAATVLEANGGLSGSTAKGAFCGTTALAKGPSGGTFNFGDLLFNNTNGAVQLCVSAGTPGVWVVHTPLDRDAQAGELLGQTFDLPTTGAELKPGVIYLAKIMVRGEMTVSEIDVALTTVGSGLTRTEAAIIAGNEIRVREQGGAKAVLPTSASEAGMVLARTSAVPSAIEWESTVATKGARQMKLRDESDTTNEKITLIGAGNAAFVHVALLCVGTTGPQMACAGYYGKLRDINMNVSGNGPIRAGKIESGATSIKAIGTSYTTSGYKKTENDPLFWIGLS